MKHLNIKIPLRTQGSINALSSLRVEKETISYVTIKGCKLTDNMYSLIQDAYKVALSCCCK